MKKNEEFSRKSAHFLKSACLALCLVSYGGSVAYAGSAYAEQTTLTVRMNNRTIKDVFSYIEKNSEFIFVYHGSNINLNRKVSVDVNNQTVESILNKMFEGTDIEYIINDRQVIVRKNEIIDKKEVVSFSQQQKKIKVEGTVSDSRGEALIGVNILVKGNSIGAVTDVDGHFILENVSPDAILTVSYIGYKTEEFPVGNKSNLRITLKDDSELLEEVVIVGYGVQKKVNLSGAVQSVSGEAMASRPINNINTGLQGLVPNLNIQLNSGRANDAPSLNIRGFTSINGGDAFILVDNVPVSPAELGRVNPSDIENVTVLKDASAAAIYGARAAFGVVLITTKKAKSDKLQINFNGNYGMRTRGMHPEYVTDPVTVMEMKNEAGRPLYSSIFTQEQIDYARRMQNDPSLSSITLDPNNPNMWAYYGNTDWQDEAYRKLASTYTADVNISKRDEKLSYYLSGGYYQEDGLLRYGNDGLKRYNFRGNADMNLTKWWKAGANVAYTNSNYDSPTFLDNDFFNNVNRTPSLSVMKNPDGSWTKDGATVLGSLQEGGRKINRVNQVQVQLSTAFDIIKDVWKLNADANFRITNDNTDENVLRVGYKMGPNEPIQYGLNSGVANEYAYFRAQETNYSVYNVYSNFTKTFNEKHFLNVMAGYNREFTNYRSNSSDKDILITSTLPEINLATGTASASNSRSQLALEGIFGRVNYIYDNKYILEFNGRYDGSSRFPSGSRWGFFPSGSVAWSLINEEFFKDIAKTAQISNFKIRGSYGALGNQVLLDDDGNQIYYPSIPSMNSGKISQILDGNRPIAVYQPGLVSSSFTWETVRTVNGGIDLGLFDNRFSASFDIYKRFTDDMLTKSKALPGVVGAKPPRNNAANLETKGWELSLVWNDQFTLLESPFRYSLKFMLADSRSKITKFDNPNRKLSDYYVGQEINEIWGFFNDGVFQSEEELKELDQTDVGTDDQSYKFYVGDTKYKDLNGDGKITKGKGTVDDPGDRRIIGNSSIRFPYSINVDASWKGIDLSMLFQGVGKRDWYPGAGNYYFWGVYAQPWTNVTVKNLDHWTPENPDANAYFPRVKAYSAEDDNELGMAQTKYLQNAAYLRLKNLTVGYTLPKNLLSKIGVNQLRLYFSAENLFTISHLDVDLDPEVSTHNSSGKYPMQQTYSFGVNLGF